MRLFSIPDLKDSLHLFGQPEKQHLPEELKILIWNVFKGKKGVPWRNDFVQLSHGNDLILIQEAMMDEEMPKLWQESLKSHQWKMATSFAYQSNHRTGVATGSRFLSKDNQVLRAIDREILFWTPKVTLSSLYHTPDETKSLLVINTHVLNFTTNKAFVRYVENIVKIITIHHGPVLLGGDFNTWNANRWNSLLVMLKGLHLEHIVFPNDERFLKLDHVFIRGIDVKSAKIRNEIFTSDHSPLELELILKP